MKIKEPLKIKNLSLKNRIVLPPMASDYTRDGLVNRQHLDYYDRLLRSEHIGLVITEHMYVSAQGMATAGQLSIADDSCLQGLSLLTDTIHRHGASCFAQINHAGFRAPEHVIGMTPVGPSAMLNTLRNGDQVWTRELEKKDISRLLEKFAAAALRAKQAGYDGVEIHSAHGYLLTQFYSPMTNRRSDEYGGSLENRLRIHLEILAAVREAVGEDYPVALRLGGCDYMPGGSTIADAVAACKLLEKAGLDVIDISGGLCGFAPMGKRGCVLFDDMSRAVKEELGIPVILTGGIVDGETAEKLLEENACDLVGIGRAMMRDPDWTEHHVYR